MPAGGSNVSTGVVAGLDSKGVPFPCVFLVAVELHMFFSSGFILLAHTGLWRGEVNAAYIVGVLRIDFLRGRSCTGTGLGQGRCYVKTAHNQTHYWDSHGMLL